MTLRISPISCDTNVTSRGNKNSEQVWQHHETPCSLWHFLPSPSCRLRELVFPRQFPASLMSHTAPEREGEKRQRPTRPIPSLRAGVTKGWQDKYLIRSVPSHPTFTCPPQHVAQCLAHTGHAVNAICFQVGRTVSKTENHIHQYKLFSKSKPSALSFSVQMIKPFYTGSPHNLVPDSTGKLIPDPTGLHSNLYDRYCYTGLSLSLHF